MEQRSKNLSKSRFVSGEQRLPDGYPPLTTDLKTQRYTDRKNPCQAPQAGFAGQGLNSPHLMTKLRNLATGFAIGDALGEVFEFRTPRLDAATERWESAQSISFTDDTILLLSSLKTLTELGSPAPPPYLGLWWSEARSVTCSYLTDWFRSGVLRGIGKTTYSALHQMFEHSERGASWDKFAITGRNYDATTSAGNGILSRAFPFLATEVQPDSNLKAWLSLTHVHPDGFRTVEALYAYLRTQQLPDEVLQHRNGNGFYAPETLAIAASASETLTAHETFCASLRPRGDNDSTAALALGLWCWKHGVCQDLKRIWKRMDPSDVDLMEAALGGL